MSNLQNLAKWSLLLEDEKGILQFYKFYLSLTIDIFGYIFILHSQLIVFSSPGTGYQEVLSLFPSRNGKIQYDHLKSNTVKTFLTFYGQSTMVSKQNSSINC